MDWRDYDPHGNIIRMQQGSLNYRYACYQGEYGERDDETGYISFEFRMYDPTIARWHVPDPMYQHHSPYMAMGNNPVSFIDPTGGEDEEGEPTGNPTDEDDQVNNSNNKGGKPVTNWTSSSPGTVYAGGILGGGVGSGMTTPYYGSDEPSVNLVPIAQSNPDDF